ncbi:MAG: diguanylate cyclase [Planctomycetota bacterium]
MAQEQEKQEPDYKPEGREVELKLLRAVALGGMRSVEIQLLLDSQTNEHPNYQALALLVSDLSVPEARARATFERLRAHQARTRERMGRRVGIKTAALDYLENIELALNLRDDEHALTYTQLAQMAFLDQLSGLANYRYFKRRFNEEIKRAARYHRLLSLLMLDLDRFKAFNDTHGHLAGNRALEHLAGVLKSEAGETDLVARYGGEEFAVLLPETAKHDALALAECIRSRLENSPVDLGEAGAQRVTASLGLATYPRDADGADALLSSADQALYAAKAAGRNRVSVFTPPSVARFEYRPDDPDAAQSIGVAGDFNGWNKAVDLLRREQDGGFSLELHLAPGRYLYKFVVNGELYISDPRCAGFEHDGYGGWNSVLVVA